MSLIENNPYVSQEETEAYAQALAQHPGGQSLITQTRWLRFKHEEESVEYYKQALGPTANVYEHLFHFTEFELLLMQNSGWSRFNQNEGRLAVLGGLGHDVGEAKIEIGGELRGVGDVPSQEMNIEIKKEEHLIALHILSQLDLDQNFVTELVEAYRYCEMGGQAVLYDFTRAAERLEYVDTAVTAYIRILQEDEGSWLNTIDYDWNLIASVLCFDLTKVLNVYADKYEAEMVPYLNERGWIIDGMFNYSESALVLLEDAWAVSGDYPQNPIMMPDRLNDIAARLPAAKALWNNWRTTH